MTERCKWAGTGNARTVPGRHDGACADDRCPGCAPCPSAHCRVCNVAHTAGACPECMAETREALREIGRMCDALPEEVENRGVDGEAMMLLGPSADPEARGHLEASVLAGRVSPDYLADAIGDTHPVWVLGTWSMIWRAELDHDEPDDGLTLAEAVDYLDRTMGYMSTWPHVPFEDYARDLRRCRAHLETVLHDGEQHDRGAPCMACGTALERLWGASDGEDGWQCPRCRRTSTEAQYRFAVAHLHREEATELTDRDMEMRTGIKAGTIRVWATRDLVRRRRDAGRTLYAVSDVVDEARKRGLVS